MSVSIRLRLRRGLLPFGAFTPGGGFFTWPPPGFTFVRGSFQMRQVWKMHTDDCCIVVAFELDRGYAIVEVGHELAVDLRIEPEWSGADLTSHVRGAYGVHDDELTWFVVENYLGLEVVEIVVDGRAREYLAA